MFECNVVQGEISLGINGTSLEAVQQTVSSILGSTYPEVSFTAAYDTDGGVNLTAIGPGGHASDSTKSLLVFDHRNLPRPFQPRRHLLLPARKHNFNICAPGGVCAFNHKPAFYDVAGTEYSYAQTEVVARALAYLSVGLLNDPAMMANAKGILRS